MNKNTKQYYLKNTITGRLPLAVGITGIVLSFVGYFVDSGQFFFSYLTAFVFWTTISLGSLFMVMLHHLTNSKWSIVLRRLLENDMIILPVMVIFFLPVIFGIHELYNWSHADADHIIQKKVAYLNVPFFLIRTAVYFLIWFIFSYFLYRISTAQDGEFRENQIKKMKSLSAPGMILFALTLTFASFDWMMSLDAHWYSTIFGVYVFGGSLPAALGFIVIMGQFLRTKGVLKDTITIEHYHDLGRLIFAFVIFWAYIAFSQYFLIWYANIPEEIIWFKHRWVGSWKIFSMVIVFGHFVVPFFVLMTRAAKRNLKVLLFISIWLLIMHWIDLFWIIMPNLHLQVAQISWMDITSTFGIGGIYIWLFWKFTKLNAIVPLKDPKLEQSINFKN